MNLPKIVATASIFLIIALTLCSNLAYSRVITPPNTTSHLTLRHYLMGYIPNSIINSSVYTNESFNGSNYTIMQMNGTGNNYIVFNISNLTAGRSGFVLNQGTVFYVLRPLLTAEYYPNYATIASLTSELKNYQAQAQPDLNDCLTETGLDNFLCPKGYNVTSCLQVTCQTTQICDSQYTGHFGTTAVPYDPEFTGGFMNFSANYSILNSSYKQYFALSTSINPINIATNLQDMQNLLNTISSISTSMPYNPVFVGSASLINEESANCPPWAGLVGGPYYCYYSGVCGLDTNFNATVLGGLQTQISTLLSSPISNSSIDGIAIASVNNGAGYFNIHYLAIQSMVFNETFNAISGSYAALAANMTFLSSKFINSSLQTAMTQLAATYDDVRAKGINQNLSQANQTLRSELANATNVYQSVAAKYVPVYKLAYNSTSLIALRELDYQVPPPSLAALATQQADLNTKLNAQVNSSEAAGLAAQTASIGSQAKGISPPFSIPATIKAVDGGVLSALLASPTTPIATKLAVAPADVAILTFIFGIIVLILIYFATYYRLNARKRISMNSRVHRAWIVLFSILFLVVIVFGFLSYVYAESANSFLPASGFFAAVHSSNTVYILVNQTLTADPSTIQCVSAVTKTLASQGITAYNMTLINGDSCTLKTNASVAGTACFNQIIASGKPTMIINPSANSSVVYKGLYGEVLYASGQATRGQACILNGIVQVS